MKYILTATILLVIVLSVSSTDAQKIYTWTDENGVLHITEQPPPEKAKVEDVMTFKERSPEELEAIQRKKNNIRREFEKQEQLDREQDAQLKAEQADKQAKEAKEEAEKEYEYNKEYIKRLSSTKRKRRQFRKKIERLKNDSEESFAEAEEAAKRAEEAKAGAEAEPEAQ